MRDNIKTVDGITSEHHYRTYNGTEYMFVRHTHMKNGHITIKAYRLADWTETHTWRNW